MGMDMGPMTESTENVGTSIPGGRTLSAEKPEEPSRSAKHTAVS